MWVSALPRAPLVFGSPWALQQPTCLLGPASCTTVSSHLARSLTHPVRSLHHLLTHLSWGFLHSSSGPIGPPVCIDCSGKCASGWGRTGSLIWIEMCVKCKNSTDGVFFFSKVLKYKIPLFFFLTASSLWGSWGGCWSPSQLHVGEGRVHYPMNRQLIHSSLWAFGDLAQGHLGSNPKVSCPCYHYTSQVLSTAKLKQRTLNRIRQPSKIENPNNNNNLSIS